MSAWKRVVVGVKSAAASDRGAAVVALAMQLLQVALGLLSTPLLLNHLGKARYSELAILWALVFFAPLLDLGLPRVVARLGAGLADGLRGADAVRALRSALRGQIVLVACVTAGFGVIALASPGAGPFLHGEVGRAFLGFCAVLVCLLLHNLLTAHLQGRGWLHRMTLIQSVAGVLNAAVPLLLWVAPLDLGQIALAFLAVRLLALGLAVAVVCRGEQLGFLGLFRGVRTATVPLIREGFSGIAYFALAPLVVYGERLLIPAISGVHSMSAHLIAVDVGLRFLVVPGLVSQYSFRSVAQGLADRSALHGVVPRYFAMIGPLFLLPLTAAVMFGNELVHAWLGAQADGLTVLCVQVVAAALGACSVSALLVQVCIAAARTGALSKLAVLEAGWYLGAVAVGSWLLGAPDQITLMASSLWALRLLVNAAMIVRIVFATLQTSALWRLLVGAILPGALALGVATVLDATLSGPALWSGKATALAALALAWGRGLGPWSVQPFKAG